MALLHHASSDHRRSSTSRAAERPHQWWVLAGFLVVCQLAGIVGLPFTDSASGTWYDQLDKPSFTPPSAVFGPAWTTLYVLMAVAGWLVWRADHPRRTLALGLFATQLVLNAAWSPLFFGAKRPGVALVEIVVLWLAVIATGVVLTTIERRAGLAWLPYAAWTTFALALNAGIVILN